MFEGGRKFGWAGPVVALVAACTPPTAVRRTTLIPTPSLPARVGAPLAGGEGRGGLELNAGHLTPDLVFEDGEFGDPGVLIPDAHLGGSFYFGLHDLIEVGGHLQYAHARICSVERQCAEKGIVVEAGNAPLARLDNSHEEALIKHLGLFAERVEAAALRREPHQVVNYLRELANLFHSWYNAHQFIVDDAGLRDARIALAMAVGQVLRNGLDLLGVSAPDKM